MWQSTGHQVDRFQYLQSTNLLANRSLIKVSTLLNVIDLQGKIMKIHANIIKMIYLDAPNKVWSSMHQRPQQIVQSGVEVLRKRRPWFHVVDVQVGSGSYPEAIAPGNTALAAQHSQLGSEQMADKAERTGRLVEY